MPGAGRRLGGVGLVRDMQDASALATHVRLAWTALYQAARRVQDKELKDIANRCGLETDRQMAWMCTALKNASPKALVVPAQKEDELAASLMKTPVPPGLPAAATTLLVALGSLKTAQDALNVMVGVLIAAAVGELLRRVRLGELRFNPKKQEQAQPAPLTFHKT